MKSIKFLAALAIPAMFAACTNEELTAVQQDAVLQGEEFVGAELVGKGISLNVSSNTGSRISASGKWTGTDKLGLGWIVSGNYSDDQLESVDPEDNALYGNHLFYYNEEKGDFNTMANIYTGWHFAYYPFTHMQKLGTTKVVEVNPVQEEEWATDKFNSCLNLSARVFLSPENLDEETYQLKDVEIAPVRVFNTIGINIQPNETFTKEANLSSLKVNSIKLNVGAGVFAKQVELHPEALAELQYNEDGAYDKDLTKNAIKESSAEVLIVKGSKVKAVETVIDENLLIDLSGNNTLRFHTLPVEAKGVTIDPKKVVFTIEVEGGTFTVKYPDGVAEDSEDAVAKANWETIQTLVAAYAKDGAMTKVGTALYNTESETAEGLSLQLTEDMFEPNFNSISTETQWNAAVKIADALGMDAVTFNIDNEGGLVFTNIDKDDENGDADLINLPEGALTVTGDKMVLNAEGTWPAEGLTVETEVEVNANLTVADGVTMTATDGIVNKGTITAGYLSHINGVANQGEIEVVYGSYVTIKNNLNGVVSYVVPSVSSELTATEIQKQIEYLIATTGNADGIPYANVNKLIVNTGNTLELTYAATSTGGSEAKPDPYRPSGAVDPTITAAELIPGLKGVSFEINGGSVTSSKSAEIKSVTINGGSLNNVSINGELTIKGGTVVADVASVAGDLTIQSGTGVVTATTIDGSVNAKNSNFTINAETINGTVSAEGENYFNVKNFNGAVTMKNTSANAIAIDGAAFKENVTLNGGAFGLVNSTLEKDLNINAGSVKANNINIDGTLNNAAGCEFSISGNDAKINKIKNWGTLTTSVNVYAETVEIFAGSKAVIESGKTIWYTKPTEGQYGYTQEGNTDGRILYLGDVILASTIEELQNALDDATEDVAIAMTNDLQGDITVTQKENVKITIEGDNHQFTGAIVVDGQSQRYETAALNINNVNFCGASDSEINAYINLGNGENAIRYTNHVTVEGCTFDGVGVVAIKSYTGGDKNLIISNCEVAENMHSFVQVVNVEEGLEITKSKVYSKGGINLNNTPSLIMNECTFDVKEYAVRLGVNGTVSGADKIFNISNSSLKSACEEDAAVIVFRDNAKLATLNLTNTSITGDIQFLGEEKANIVK